MNAIEVRNVSSWEGVADLMAGFAVDAANGVAEAREL